MKVCRVLAGIFGIAVLLHPSCRAQTDIQPGQPASSRLNRANDLTTSADFLGEAERLAKWQMDHMPASSQGKAHIEGPGDPKSWQQATFLLGMTALADPSRTPWARQAILAHVRDTQWELGGQL